MVSNDSIDRPSATADHGQLSMAYLRSTDDLDRLDQESLTDEQRAFLDDTDFSTSAIIAVQIELYLGGEIHPNEVLRRPGQLEARFRIQRGHITSNTQIANLVRVTPENGLPDDVTVVVVNDPWNDGEPTRIGTAGSGQ